MGHLILARAAAPATNEPGGMIELTARSFAAKVENDWLDRGDVEFTIETGQGGPEGDNSVGQALFPEGFTGTGSAPINTYYSVSGNRTALFLRIRGFRVSTNWYGHDGASINKVFFIWHGSGPSIYLQLKGSGAGSLFFRVNTQFASDVQTRDYEFGQTAAGGTDFECTRGTFYDVEILCQENSVGSVDDGRIRMWVKASTASTWTLVADSNAEVPFYDNGQFSGLVMYDEGEAQHFDGEQRWNPTYGGGGGSSVPADQYQQIDYIRIAAA